MFDVGSIVACSVVRGYVVGTGCVLDWDSIVVCFVVRGDAIGVGCCIEDIVVGCEGGSLTSLAVCSDLLRASGSSAIGVATL